MLPASGAAAAPRYRRFKPAIFILLAANAVAFAFFGRASEALDSIAWFALLALFELETAHPQHLRGKRGAALVRAGRLVAGVAVVIAAAGFVYEREWLDATNAMLWIAVVVMLEIEVRYLDAVGRHRAFFAGVSGALYAALASLVLVWTWRGEWLDAYDAALWLVAFVTIEINLLQITHTPDAV